MKYQLVFWPVFCKHSWCPPIYFTQLRESGIGEFLVWSLRIGPMEVRRWK
jgi:hypothetical protein